MVFRSDKNRMQKQVGEKYKQPKPLIQTTTLWDFPSQHYGQNEQGDGEYAGVTPSYVIWNLLQRYTKPGAVVLDPMCGSGTTLDVCKDLDREGKGFDISPVRADIQKGDARKLPVKNSSVDFVFVDPPYGTHIKYSGDKSCIGELDQRGPHYYSAMEKVLAEMYRVLKDGCYAGIYVQDSYAKGKDFAPLGFELFLRMSVLMQPVDIICVTRHNKKLKRNHWHTSAIEGNYYLRGFNYLFIFRKIRSLDAEKSNPEESGSLSFYFRQASKSRPGEVMTPEVLAQVIQQDRQVLDKKLIRRDGKRNFKKMVRDQKFNSTRTQSGRKKEDATTDARNIRRKKSHERS
jgi:SAM-dependent methyltransferase